MNRLHIAKLVISIDSKWNLGCNFKYSCEEGMFIYDNKTRCYRGNGLLISEDISCVAVDNRIELTKGFIKPLNEEELKNVEDTMKVEFMSLLREYKGKLLERRKYIYKGY